MNSKERVELRKRLADSGLTRSNYTPDDGDGRYAEMWGNAVTEDVVVISWGPRGES